MNGACCSQYKLVTNYQVASVDKSFAVGAYYGTGSNVYVNDSDYNDAAIFKAVMLGVQLVYELATPIEYPLTPAQLKTLKGANVIFTDLNGNITPTYWTH